MQLSVIILNYNVRYFLEQCVLSVQKALYGMEAEIIVVDNASKDDSCAMMKACFPNVTLIENNENFGFPKGNNIGVAAAKGEYICILNPDTVVAEDTFQKILQPQQWKSDTGIMGCKLIDGTGNFLPECKRGIPTPWVAFTKILGLYKWFPKNNLFNQYYAQHVSEDESGQIDILVGAFLVLKRELYTNLGGFDENCFMYSDDIDLCYMALKLGKVNYYYHETSIIHYKGESTVRDYNYVQRFRKAMQFFYKKHYGGSFFFNVFMKIGTFIFSLFKQQQQKNSTKKIDQIIFLTNETNVPTNLKFDKIVNSIESITFDHHLNTEIIFDTRCFSFKEIIAFMESNKENNLTFKNYISKSDFLIGSNHANDLGEVINLTKFS